MTWNITHHEQIPAPDSTAVRVALWRALHEAGFRDVQHVSAAALAQRYFAGRTDGLRQ